MIYTSRVLDGNEILTSLKKLFKEMESYKKTRDRNAFPEDNTKTVEITIKGHRVTLFTDFDNVSTPQWVEVDGRRVASYSNRRIPDLNKLAEKLSLFIG